MKILDLFCGAGGASQGYYLAGFDVVGVDLNPQPRYPFQFIQANALDVMADSKFMSQFDAFHASPPCQGYSTLRAVQRDQPYDYYVVTTRDRLTSYHKPYVIENVPGAPLRNYVNLCGTSFGLPLRRHRIFESNIRLEGQACYHESYPKRFEALVYGTKRLTAFAPVYGSHTNSVVMDDWSMAMGIDWMNLEELVEAIPPAYTEFLGNQLFTELIARSQ